MNIEDDDNLYLEIAKNIENTNGGKMTENRWFDFDKVDCIKRLSDANDCLLQGVTYCSDKRICKMIKKEMNSITKIIDAIIKEGVFENEE